MGRGRRVCGSCLFFSAHFLNFFPSAFHLITSKRVVSLLFANQSFYHKTFFLSPSLSLPPPTSLSRSALTVLITNDHNTLRMPHRELVRTNPSDHRFGSCTVSISSLQIPHHPFPGVTTIRVDPPLSQLARWGES